MDKPASATESLSRREREIAKLYADGSNYREIAERLCIAPATVRTHVGTIYRKLGVSTKIELRRTLGDGESQRERVPRSETASQDVPSRRHVTVLSAAPDAIGRLAEELSPDDLAEVIAGFQDEVAEAARIHGGLRIGQGSAESGICFGVPEADETDPERAVNCALEIERRCRARKIANDRILAVRIGVYSGPVIVKGDALEPSAVIGGAAYMAAQLGREARGGGIVVCARTQAALGGLFGFTELGAVEIDGASALQTFSVSGAASAVTRFEALHGYRLSPFVGRQHEVSLLESLFRRAMDGVGQAALILGEPGIGKSRIVRTLCDNLSVSLRNLLVFQCSPHERTSTLHAIASTLRQRAGVDALATPGARLDAVSALFGGEIAGNPVARELIGNLTLLPYQLPEGTQPIAADRRQSATLDLLDRFVRRCAGERGQVIVFEDLHWADPTTLVWLEQLIGEVESWPVLILCTARPEFSLPAGIASNVTTLALPRLGKEATQELVSAQCGEEALPPEVMRQIAERSGGIPLYVEEIARALLEVGQSENAVPVTLAASLTSRLDRLGAGKAVAQAASVIGRDFEIDVLREIVGLSPAQFEKAVKALLASRLVLRRTGAGPGAHQFRHALIRDAAYESLLRGRREYLHARIADCLATLNPEISAAEPELLAHHYSEAGLAEKAVTQWLRAGEHAAARSAHLEAISHLSKGLELLATLPETRDRIEKELALKIALGPSILATRGFGDLAFAETYERARELAEQLQDDSSHFTALWGLWIHNLAAERFETAETLTTQLLSAVGRQSDSAILLQAHHAAWTTDFFRGKFASCLDHTEKGESYYDRQRHHTHKFRYGGHDPAVCNLSFRSLSEWLMGFPDRALASSQRAVDLAIEIDHSNSHAQALMTKAMVHYFRGEAEAAYETGEAMVALSVEHGLGMWTPLLQEVSRAALASCGRGEQVLDATRESLATLQRTGVGVFGPYRFAAFVDALRRTGQHAAAAESLGYLDAAQSMIDRKGESWFQAEILRLRGEVLLDEAPFHVAIETARAMKARSLELRAATSLARHWVNNHYRRDAHDLLAPVYGWFTEGFDTADLIEAKALLDELC